MGKKEVGLGIPVAVSGVTLIPITEVSVNYWHGNSGTSFFSVKQPISVVVVSQSVKRAFRVSGEEIPLDQLIREVPAIKEILEQI